MFHSWHRVVWMLPITCHPQQRAQGISWYLKLESHTLKINFLVCFSDAAWTHTDTHTQTAGSEAEFWILTLTVFQGVSYLTFKYSERGWMTPLTCSLFNSMAAFQHEKKPNELNVSPSKDTQLWSALMHSSRIHSVHTVYLNKLKAFKWDISAHNITFDLSTWRSTEM